jgi:hypothetical protein
MRLLIKRVWLAVLVLGLAVPALGEYYQYTDPNGVLRFTDDITNVPQDQRPDVKTYESVKSDPIPPEASQQAELQGPQASSAPSSGITPPQTGTWSERISGQADELDRLQEELNQTFLALQNERTTLEKTAPAVGAPAEESAAYRQKVAVLNAKIDRYEKQHAEYRQKESAFRTQYKK